MSTQLEIVTAEQVTYSGEVEAVVLPGVSGELGVLPHHAPLLTFLKPGELRIVTGNEEEFIAVTGGFLEVLENHVRVLADTAERLEEIDLERAEAAMVRAKERIAADPSNLDMERALASIRRADLRVQVVRRRRSSQSSRLPRTPNA